MSDPSGSVGVTGASGYLGRSLVDALRASDRDVVRFQRRADDGARALQLGEPVNPAIFDGVSTLIHAAWDLKETDPRRAWGRNVGGSKEILAAALAAGVQRVIFVSSMSAYFGTKQNYGLMKMSVERAMLEAHQVVVRPGLVYGSDSGGMAGTLAALARLPIIPVFRDATQYTVHIDDFVEAMMVLVTAIDVPSSVIGLAHDPPIDFRALMRSLAIDAGGDPRTITIPWRPLLVALAVAEKLSFPLPVRSDSLLGLVRPAPSLPGREVAAQLGLTFRAFGAPSPTAQPD